MMLLKIDIRLVKIMCSCNSLYIWCLSNAKDFTCKSAGAQTSRRPNVPAPKRPAPIVSVPGQHPRRLIWVERRRTWHRRHLPNGIGRQFYDIQSTGPLANETRLCNASLCEPQLAKAGDANFSKASSPLPLQPPPEHVLRKIHHCTSRARKRVSSSNRRAREI